MHDERENVGPVTRTEFNKLTEKFEQLAALLLDASKINRELFQIVMQELNEMQEVLGIPKYDE